MSKSWVEALAKKVENIELCGNNRRGQIIVARDPDICDMYIARVVDASGLHGSNLACEVLEMVNYPIQHTIIYPDIAHENPPLLPGQVAMLAKTGDVCGLYPMETGGRVIMQNAMEYYNAVGSAGYWATFNRCIAEYTRRVQIGIDYAAKHPAQFGPGRNQYAPNPMELVILARHKDREFEGRRSCLV